MTPLCKLAKAIISRVLLNQCLRVDGACLERRGQAVAVTTRVSPQEQHTDVWLHFTCRSRVRYPALSLSDRNMHYELFGRYKDFAVRIWERY